MRKLVLALSMLGLLSACSGVSDYLAGDDNSVPPAPLSSFDAVVGLKQRWSASNGAGDKDQRVRLVPAVTNTRVYAADSKGRVSAYDALSGERLWQVETAAPVTGGVGLGENLVLLGTRDGEVIALDVADGEQRWRGQASSEVLSIPRADLGMVVVQTVDGKLTGLSAEDGSRQWIYDRTVPALTLRGTASPALAEGLVVAGFSSGKLVALGIEKGRLLWETSVAVPSGRSELERMVDLDADPVISNGAVFVVGFQGRLAVLDLASGKFLWARDLSSAAGLGVDRGQVYVTDEQSHVWALDARRNASLWKQEDLHDRALTSPVPFGDYVVVGDFEGYLHLLSRQDGSLAGRVRVDSSGLSGAPVVVGDTLYVQGRSGTLKAYELGKP